MVQLETVTGDKMCGVVRYCGEWPGAGHTNTGPAHARWCGVELEEEIRGGGHGWVQVSIVTLHHGENRGTSQTFSELGCKVCVP